MKNKSTYKSGGSNSLEKIKKINDTMAEKKGIAVGSYLEGGTIKYKNNGPKNPGDNKILAGITAGVSAAAAWNKERMAKRDVSRYQAAGLIADPTSKLMSDDDALKKVTELRSTKEGRQQLRGLRATGKRNVNIKDFRAKQKEKKKNKNKS